ncbi:hypothetical protein [Myroides guanonis]|uniref:CarboxypepD_reg-like domain-containing protein n=1 Tax=Myroides guanonis TaxID=1150112 RepID=A0A1I3RV46_9FLAO|nr:hypothetical protein [Myroides guanonis]SFJ50238.1 hypothetical protein SAMN04487893_10927 [Myroides guanonis]
MKLFSCFLFLLTFSSFAQSVQLIDGRVRFSDGIQRKVVVENKVSGEEVNADSTGFFSINISKGDVLLFKVEFFPDRSIVINGTEGDYLGVVLSEHELDEIVIEKKMFVDNYFGEIAKYTPAERRYRTSNNMFFGDGISGFGLDPIVNLFSGRRKEQRKAILYEKQEFAKNKFLEIYTKSILMSEFGIAENHITSFAYFIVAQPGFDEMSIDLSPEYKLYVAEMYSEFVK